MKKVTLLGDSIRMIGYGKTVAEALNKEGIEVFSPKKTADFQNILYVCFSTIKIRSRGAT